MNSSSIDPKRQAWLNRQTQLIRSLKRLLKDKNMHIDELSEIGRKRRFTLQKQEELLKRIYRLADYNMECDACRDICIEIDEYLTWENEQNIKPMTTGGLSDEELKEWE